VLYPTGLFGGGVLMYFTFLKWLVTVNICIFLLVLFIIIIPQVAFPLDTTHSSPPEINLWHTDRAVNCSALYVVNYPERIISAQSVVDLLQGTVSTDITQRKTKGIFLSLHI